MRPLLAALALALVPAQGLTGETDPAARLLERAAEVERRGPALAEIWPGYWPPGQPFVLYLPEVGAAFGGEASPGGATFRPGQLEDVRFSFVIDYDSGAEDTILQRMDTVEESLDTLFHEQFHDYQSAAFVSQQGAVGEYVDLSAVSDLEGFVVGIELERQLLAAAVAAPDELTRRMLARQFIAARDARLDAAAPRIRAAEDHFERSEGTATYAGVMATAVLAAEGSDIVGQIRARLAEPLSGGLASSLFRGRAYGVGAAQAWLLDALDAPDWRREVAQGAGLADLLKARLDQTGPQTVAPPAPSARLVSDVRSLLAASPAPPANAAAFLAAYPHWLEVVLDVPFSRAEDIDVSFSGSLVPLPGGDLALPLAASVLIEIEGFRLEAKDRTALIQYLDDPERSRTHVHVSVTPEEARTLADGTHSLDVTTLRLIVPAGALVDASPAQRVVRLDP